MCNCPEGYFELTSKIDAYGGIPNYGCENDLTISAIWIPNTVKNIGTQAFYGCENLERIEFEDGGDADLSIGLMAFENCSKLREVKFPKRLSSIGAACFRGCTALERIEFNGGNSVFREPGHVFDGCPHKENLLSMLRTECARRSAALTHATSNITYMRKSRVVNEESRRCFGIQNKLPDDYKCKELDQILLENPWRKFGEDLEKCRDWSALESFALEEDLAKIEKFNLHASQAHRLQVEQQQPIPFIGSPEAKVWLLLMNPFFSRTEYYTFIDMKKGFNGVQACLNNGWVLHEEAQTEEAFRRRQKLYASSLGFKNLPSEAFYILDESMRIFDVGSSGYTWYGKHLMGGEWDIPTTGNCGNENAYFHVNHENKMEVASRHLFCLEYIPYPSNNFGNARMHEDFAHAKFWRDLVNYALGHDKILIVRGSVLEVLKNNSIETLYGQAVREGRVLSFKNEQNISISRANIMSVDGNVRAIDAYCESL